MFNFEIKSEKYTGKTLHDLGTIIIMCALFLAGVIMGVSDSEFYKENILMLIVVCAVAILAAFRVASAAVILAAVQTIAYIGYRFYTGMSGNQTANAILYVWIIIPGLVAFGYILLLNSQKDLERQNAIMKDQINELVMIDELTGLYNLRSMYMDIQTQISYAERNDKHICLMILKPKYYKELKKVLKKKQLEEVIVRLSKVITDTVRLEDKVYAIDNKGEFGVILTCDREGSRLVEERLCEKLSDEKLFEGIVNSNKLKVEMLIGCLEHSQEYARDAILFKSKVEEALGEHDKSVVK